MQNISFLIGFCFSFFFLVSSCQEGKVKTLEIREIKEWKANEGIKFEHLQIDSSDRLLVLLEHSNDYAFENLYLKVRISANEQELIEEKIISIQLLDENGLWIGKPSGKNRLLEYPLVLDYLAMEKRNFHLEVFQYSREEVLSHINSIGIGKVS